MCQEREREEKREEVRGSREEKEWSDRMKFARLLVAIIIKI